jgi:sirohydrochlorin ferrochelatase
LATADLGGHPDQVSLTSAAGALAEPARPVLIACAHGTRSPAGRRSMAELRLAIATLRPGLDVWAANVDVQQPSLDTTLTRLAAAGRTGVIVPLLLSGGYHVHHDIADIADMAPAIVRFAPALGPDDRLAHLLLARLSLLPDGIGADPHVPVVLAGAGSSDARALADVERIRAALTQFSGRIVIAGHLSAARPTVTEAIAEARRESADGRLCIANYLLAPGYLDDRLTAIAEEAEVPVTSPLGADPVLAALALRRYDAVQGLL